MSLAWALGMVLDEVGRDWLTVPLANLSASPPWSPSPLWRAYVRAQPGASATAGSATAIGTASELDRQPEPLPSGP